MFHFCSDFQISRYLVRMKLRSLAADLCFNRFQAGGGLYGIFYGGYSFGAEIIFILVFYPIPIFRSWISSTSKLRMAGFLTSLLRRDFRREDSRMCGAIYFSCKKKTKVQLLRCVFSGILSIILFVVASPKKRKSFIFEVPNSGSILFIIVFTH